MLIIIGYSTCALLDGGHSFLNDERNGFANSLNFGIFIINVVVLFFLNLLNAIINRLERLCSIIGVILFIIAFGIMIWYLIEYEVGRNYVIGATALIGIQMAAFIWDYQILGQAF
uniref:Chitin synthase export chaperone n=1 Tax=Meloidogyne javanica TaxID=6303 RepID=A0A915LIR1_MELJA